MHDLRTAIAKLIELKDSDKFFPDLTVMYPGAETERRRQHLHDMINQFIDDLILVVTAEESTPEDVRDQFKVGLMRFNALTLEPLDKERVCQYFEEIRRILGFENIDALLNRWRRRGQG